MKAAAQTTELGLSFTSKERLREARDFVIRADGNVAEFDLAMRSLQCPETISCNSERLDWQAPRGLYSKSLREIMDVDDFPKDWEINSIERDLYSLRFEDALQLIKHSLPNVYECINLTIFKFFFARRPGYGGGSVSSKIGMIWLAPEPSWTIEFWAENIVHEFIHNALFLEDMVYGVFPYTSIVMSQPEACVISSIRKQSRGYDKSFHAAFVALGIIRFYISLNDHDKARQFVAPLIKSVEGLTEKEHYLSDNGRRLLRELVGSVILLPSETSMPEICFA